MRESQLYDSRYTRYQTDRSRFRRWVRNFYLNRAVSLVSGRTLDFGCGVGELLRRLPKSSIGVEYNRDTVGFCQEQGLDVRWYDGFSDGWALSPLAGERFQSMVISHVLEHFDDPASVLAALLKTCVTLDVGKVLIIVPGPAGFKLDPTHRCYVDEPLIQKVLTTSGRWSISSQRRFPVNVAAIGRFFPHHELQILLVFDRGGDSPPVITNTYEKAD